MLQVQQIEVNDMYAPISEAYDEKDVHWSKSLEELHPQYPVIIKDVDLLIEHLTDLGIYEDHCFLDLENLRCLHSLCSYHLLICFLVQS